MIDLINTEFGFQFGPVKVTRIAHHDKNGWVVLQLNTDKSSIQIAVLKSGKIRISLLSGSIEIDETGKGVDTDANT